MTAQQQALVIGRATYTVEAHTEGRLVESWLLRGPRGGKLVVFKDTRDDRPVQVCHWGIDMRPVRSGGRTVWVRKQEDGTLAIDL